MAPRVPLPFRGPRRTPSSPDCSFSRGCPFRRIRPVGDSMDKLTYRPRLVFWELTKGCNLRCIHCRATATQLSSPDDLRYEECATIIDQLAVFAPFILV